MAKKLALGKGLNALLPDVDLDAPATRKSDSKGPNPFKERDAKAAAGTIAEIDIALIAPNPYQPRHEFDEEAIEELAASIQELGIIQPLTVRAKGKKKYELISGERRLRAAKRAGLEKVPAYIREADTEAMLEMAIVENVQREALNPIEVALGYQRLIDECSLTQEKVAQKVGKKRATVANFLRLLKLSPAVQAALKNNSVTMGHARALIPVDDEEKQIALLDSIVQDGLNVREVEERVRSWQEVKKAAQMLHELGETPGEKKKDSVDPFGGTDRDQLEIQNIAGRLRDFLSTQVQIRHKAASENGRIEIEYYSNEDLERLLDLILPR